MPRLGGRSELNSLPPEGTGSTALAAGDRIEAACELAVAGKLALRNIAAWVRGFNVSDTEFRLLWLLFQHDCSASVRDDALDQGELARKLVISPAQVSGIVERLYVSALIDRVPYGVDRRRQVWSLASAGHALVGDVIANIAKHGELETSQIPPLTPPFEGGESEAA